METTEIKERMRILALEQDCSEYILEVKQEMNKSGKRFYTCSVAGYQLLIIGTTDGRWVHTFIPTIEYLQEVTKG